MAAKFTHIEALKQCLELLEHGTEAQQELADFLRDRELFRFACLGAIAPDIFYFYRLFSRRKNARGLVWGNRAHHSRVFEFGLACLEQIRGSEDPTQLEQKRQLAFALGYLCHCGVDIVTHPYIFYITGDPYSEDEQTAWDAQSHHLRVEFALDAYLIHKRWGLSPREYNFMKYLRGTTSNEVVGGRRGRKQLMPEIRDLWVRALQATFPEEFEQDYPGELEQLTREDLVNEAYLAFLRFNSITDVRSGVIRFFLYLIDWLTLRRLRVRYLILPQPKRIDARLPNEAGNEWKYPAEPEHTSNETFMELVHRAARFSMQLMSDGNALVQGSFKRADFEKKYSGYNLDTGTRSDSIAMRAFDPIRDED